MEKQAVNNLLVARLLLTIGRGQHTRDEIEKKYNRRYPKTNVHIFDVEDMEILIQHALREGFIKKDKIKDKDGLVLPETTVYEKTNKGWSFTSKP